MAMYYNSQNRKQPTNMDTENRNIQDNIFPFTILLIPHTQTLTRSPMDNHHNDKYMLSVSYLLIPTSMTVT